LYGSLPDISSWPAVRVIPFNQREQRTHPYAALENKRSFLTWAVLRGFGSFLRTYIVRADFLDGGEGLLLAVSNGEAPTIAISSRCSRVIISTYNRPDALAVVLEGYLAQTDKDFDVVIADDGSTDVTSQ
jgi:glycosyl transferase family 2